MDSLHVVEIGNLALLVGNDGEADAGAGHLIDVVDPALVAAEGVGRQADELDAALGELGFQASERAEFGGADRRVVLGVREEDDPLVADELVEVNGAVGGVGLEVGGGRAQAKAERRTLTRSPSSLVLPTLKDYAPLRPRRGMGGPGGGITYGAGR